MSGTSITGTDRYLNSGGAGTYGRIRAVTLHKGMLYVSSSNRDHAGAGSLKPNDDKIIRINPSLL